MSDGQFDCWQSVSSQRVTEESKASLIVVGNHEKSVKGIREDNFAETEQDRAGTKSKGLVIRRLKVESPSLNG